MFSENQSVIPPDHSTLFTTSGMQIFKPLFQDLFYTGTHSTLQTCLRLNDLKEIGDGTHHLVFHMLGLFSFRDWPLQKSINFWLEFLRNEDIYPDYVTIHPDKLTDWSKLYPHDMEIRPDIECVWSDGNIGGFCTEFYKQGIEIGNIVNPLGTCIDVGFGFERLQSLKYGTPPMSKIDILKTTCEVLIHSNIVVGHNKQGYILKKLLTELFLEGGRLDHEFFETIKLQQRKNFKIYLIQKTKSKNQDKDSSFWLDTFGIDEKRLDAYQKF